MTLATSSRSVPSLMARAHCVVADAPPVSVAFERALPCTNRQSAMSLSCPLVWWLPVCGAVFVAMQETYLQDSNGCTNWEDHDSDCIIGCQKGSGCNGHSCSCGASSGVCACELVRLCVCVLALALVLVCLCLFACACSLVCLFACALVCLCACACACACVLVRLCACALALVRLCACACALVRLCACACALVRLCACACALVLVLVRLHVCWRPRALARASLLPCGGVPCMWWCGCGWCRCEWYSVCVSDFAHFHACFQLVALPASSLFLQASSATSPPRPPLASAPMAAASSLPAWPTLTTTTPVA